MSFGGKEALIKAVIQAIPAYAVYVFKLPKQIIKGIIPAISQFWWGDDDQQKHIHWFAWWKMCVPKKQEGMVYVGKAGLEIDFCTRISLCYSTESKILSIRGHTKLSAEEREFLYMAKHLGKYQNFQKRTHVASW
jgi:hypothetical protein